jgi:hypothetical protein
MATGQFVDAGKGRIFLKINILWGIGDRFPNFI